MVIIAVSDEPPQAIFQVSADRGVEMGRIFDVEQGKVSPPIPLGSIFKNTPYHDWRKPEPKEAEQLFRLAESAMKGAVKSG